MAGSITNNLTQKRLFVKKKMQERNRTPMSYDLMKLVDENKLTRLTDCPPKDAIKKKKTVFRFVHEPIEEPKNFQSERRQNPKRQFRPDKACVSYGLSAYESEQGARNSYQEMCKRFGKFPKKAGKHLAIAHLEKDDGLITSPSDDFGHVTLFPDELADLSSKFQIVGELDA